MLCEILFGTDEGKEDYSASVMSLTDGHSVTVVASFEFILSVEQMDKVSKWTAEGTVKSGHYKTWKEFKKAHRKAKGEYEWMKLPSKNS